MGKQYHNTKQSESTHASPIHEAQLAAALLSPDYRDTILQAMGTFGPSLFSVESARYVYNCVSQDPSANPMSLVEKTDAPDGLQRFLLQSLDILHSWETGSRKNLVPTVEYCATLARQRLMHEALAKGLPPYLMQEEIANLPTTTPQATTTFCDLLQARYQFLLDNIGIPQKHVVQTTYNSLNSMMQGGFRDGELIVLAARPGMGKTALALCIAIALSFQRGVDFYSMEMGQGEILDRCLSILLGIPNKHILQPSHALQRWQQAVAQFDQSMDLRLEDRGSLTLNEMLYRSKGRIPIIDYLQLVPGLDRNDKFESRQLQVTAMSKACKEYARTNATPVIILSQLNREVERRKDKRPLPSDLRESGAVEQDADKILFIYRDSVYTSEEPLTAPHAAEIIVSKQRNGPTGVVQLTFEPEFGRFVEAS